MAQRNKIGSFVKLVAGSSVAFVGYNFYEGNDKFYDAFYKNTLPIAHRWVAPEFAHFLAIKCAKYSIGTNFKSSEIIYPNLETNLWNLKFNNPIGLAAGFDKHGEAAYGLSKVGFGFIEIGSITPKPQQGNDKPRLFRLIEDQSIINRYGFNSVGHRTAKNNISKQRYFLKQNYPVGINLGKNKTTENAIDDYIRGLEEFKNLASYFVINISSPNTPGLRDLQNQKELDELLKQLQAYKNSSPELINVPLFIKIAPDLTSVQEEQIAKLVLKHKIDGLIISNTTIDKSNLKDQMFVEQDGGLSGKALEKRSTELIGRMYKLTKGKIPLIGVGGVSSGQDAYNKILAGASLVQVYSSLVYDGPLVVNRIKKELSELLEANGYKSVNEAVGKAK